MTEISYQPDTGPLLDTPDGLPYPVQIIEDRYSGVYAGGLWLAACGHTPLSHSPSQAGDVEAFEFFCNDATDTGTQPWSHRTSGPVARIGRGHSPDAALRDLIRRWQEAGTPSYFSWDGESWGEGE